MELKSLLSLSETEKIALILKQEQQIAALESKLDAIEASHNWRVIEQIKAWKKTEEALRESEHRYRIVSELASDYAFSFRVNDDGSLTREWVTDAFLQVTGYTPDESEASGGWASLVHPDDISSAATVMRTILAEKVELAAQYRIITKDGGVRHIVSFQRPQVDLESGRIVRIFGAAKDITDQVNAEEELREQKELLQMIIDHIPVIIAFFDEHGEFRFVNRQWEQVLGWALEEMRHINVMEKFYPDPAYRQDVLDYMMAAPPGWRDFKTVVHDGSVIDTSWANVRLSNGMRIGIGQDVSQRRHAEDQAFELAVERARVDVLGDFIRNTSHDLRTPLSVINTSLYLLEKGREPERQQERIDVIKEQIAHMTRVIDELKTMSALDQHVQPELSLVDVNLLVGNLTDHILQVSAQKAIDVVWDLAPNLPLLHIDHQLIKLAYQHLVENAVLYTESGGSVTIRTACQGEHVMIAVEDTGVGISPIDLPHIFDRYYKVNSARTSDRSGVGLGLTMAKRIIEAHGGDIEVESVPGKGSIFALKVPVHPFLNGSTFR